MEDIAILKTDLKLRQSCAEEELEPFLMEAIQYCEQQLERLDQNQINVDDETPEKFVSLAELNNKLSLKKSHSEKKEDLEINKTTCFYFY